MVGIAINENVIISKVEKPADKKQLIITFSQVEEKPVSFFQKSKSSEIVTISSGEAIVRMWQFKVPTYTPKNGVALTRQEKLTIIDKDVQETKNKLGHILSRYMPVNDIQWNLYEGIDIDDDNYEDKWLTDSVLLEMFSNIADQFIAYISPFVGDTSLLSRLKLVRQKDDKPFPNFPDAKYLSTNPFYESMEVPADVTKIKFSKYEIDKGLTNNEVPSQTEADAVEPASEEVTKSVFGKR